MNRRKLLKSMAAGGLTSIAATATGAASKPTPGRTSELDALHVVRGEDEIVRTVENPTPQDLKRMEELLAPSESLVTSDWTCATYCVEDCPKVCDSYTYQCHYECSCDLGCASCCSVSEN